MEKFRQQLLVVWADYWLHHVLRIAAEVGAAVMILGGTATTVATVVPAHHRARLPTPAPVVTAPRPAPKAITKKSTPPPTPTASAPVVAPAPKPVAPVPTPVPIASSQPSPGTGVKQLVPTPAPPSSSGSSSSPPVTTSTTGSTSSNAAPAPATGGYYSTNWSGYAALSGTFTAVAGSWTVPAVTGDGTDTTADAAWIGIGGVSSADLIQTGTVDTVDPDGTVTVSVFYELLPAAAMEITGFTVQVGDNMTASISQLPGGKWSITITDTTTGQTYSTLVDYTSTYSSAEWIEEDPSYTNGSLVPFNSFDHIIFGTGSTTMNGSSASIASSNAAPITLVDDNTGKPIVTPSVLTGGGFWALHN